MPVSTSIRAAVAATAVPAAPTVSSVATPTGTSVATAAGTSVATATGTDPDSATPAAQATEQRPDVTPRPGSQEVSVDPDLFRDSGGAGEGYYFRSPSGNVSCGLFPEGTSVGYLGCQAVTSVAPDEGEVCSNGPTSKYAVREEGTGPIHYCTNQGYFTGSENIRTLQYGEIIDTGQSYCVSREDGIACARVGSNAFVLSREQNITLR